MRRCRHEPRNLPFFFSLQGYNGVRLVDEHDWDSLSAEIRVLSLRLKLYMASENCYVSERKHLLLKKTSRWLLSP